MTKLYIVLGATGGVGKSIVHQLQSDSKSKLLMIGRDYEELLAMRARLVAERWENHSIEICTIDLSCNEISCDVLVAHVSKSFDTEVYIVSGASEPHTDCGLDSRALKYFTNVNYTSIATIIAKCIEHSPTNSKLMISVAGSIAILLPRKHNVIYTAAKSALLSYVRSICRNKFEGKWFKIQYVVLGFVDTRMNIGSPKFLTSDPNIISKKIINSLRISDSPVVYIPSYWKIIGLGLKIIPDFLLR